MVIPPALRLTAGGRSVQRIGRRGVSGSHDETSGMTRTREIRWHVSFGGDRRPALWSCAGRERGTEAAVRRMGHSTRRRTWWRAIVAATLSIASLGACVPSGTPPVAGVDPTSGFPTGTFAKDIVDPPMGRVRLHWVFGPDGRWAEVPEALDGQALPAPPVRGTYRVDGDLVTIATDFPAGWGTSSHRWRLDGDELWTTFESSDNPDDEGWFAMLDATPWRRDP
jgi:hypothetical protein